MSGNLKIAVNTRLLLPQRMEGIARFIHEISSRLVSNHPEVEFHFLFDRPYDDRFIYSDNVIPHVLFPPSRHPILWYWWFEYSVNRFLKKNDIDVFFSGDMYLSLKSKIPCLYVSHDLNYIHYPQGLRYSHQLFLKSFFPRYHRKADHIITVSEFSKSDIVQQYAISPDKISIAYNDVPSGFRKFNSEEIQSVRDRFSSSVPFFIYVGSLHPRKNLERLLRAFDKFKTENALPHKLLVYGRKAFKTGTIFSTYDTMQTKSEVVFVDQDQCSVPEILPAAEALIYPSLFEGFGIPILEAFHSGIPVITSNVSSMPEVAGNAALLVEPESIESISQAMHTILQPELRQRLLAEAEKQKKQFDWNRSAQLVWGELFKLSKPQGS